MSSHGLQQHRHAVELSSTNIARAERIHDLPCERASNVTCHHKKGPREPMQKCSCKPANQSYPWDGFLDGTGLDNSTFDHVGNRSRIRNRLLVDGVNGEIPQRPATLLLKASSMSAFSITNQYKPSNVDNLHSGVGSMRSHGDQNHWDATSFCNFGFIGIVVRKIFQHCTALLLHTCMSFICSHSIYDD